VTEERVRLCAVRGATSVDADTSAAIGERTAELLRSILERNHVVIENIVSIIFTDTPDLCADFPAVAALGRCVRVLMHVYVPEGHAIRHVYLHEARQLRLDLPE
jgi:chorismate mutase